MKKILVVASMLFLFVMLSSVASAVMTVTCNSPIDNAVLNREDTYNVNVTIAGWTGVTARKLILDIWDNAGYTGNMVYYRSERNVTGNGNHTFVVNGTSLPFNGQHYYIRVRICNANYTILASDVVNQVSIGAPWRANTNRLAIALVDPPAYDLGAGRVVGRGVEFSLTTVSATSIPVHIFRVQADANGVMRLQGYGSRVASYKEEYTVDENGTGILVGFDWTDETTSKDAHRMRDNYYMFFGIPYGTGVGFYKCLNTIFTCPDMTAVSGNSVLSEVNPDSLSAWSVNDFNMNTTFYLGSGGGGTYKYVGYFIYYETYPSWHNQGGYSPTGLTGNALTIQAWANSIGLPFLPLIFGALIPGVMAGLLYRYMRKWKISLPNYAYMLVIIAGVSLSYYIGFFELWMFVLFILAVSLTVLMKWREQIEETFHIGRGKDYEESDDGDERTPRRNKKKQYGDGLKKAGRFLDRIRGD